MINQKIGFISLKNQGGFNVRMDLATPPQNKPGRIKGSRKEINLGRTETRNLGDFTKLEDGAIITIWADVRAGKDKQGNIWFIYEAGNPQTANFVISGTTTINTLGFVGIS